MIGLEIIILLVCLVGSAFYSGIETGAISINRMRLRHFVKEDSEEAALLQEMLDVPDRLLGTTLIGTNVCNVACSVVGASVGIRLSQAWGPVVAPIVVTIVLLIFGEYLPKTWFQALPYARSSRFAKALHMSWRAMRPVVSALTGITRLLVPGPSESFSHKNAWVTREEIKILAREVETGGMLSRRERVMIQSVIELSRRTASDIMQPRSTMTTVAADTTIAELCGTARRADFTRLPVLDADNEKFVGVVNMYDVISAYPPDSTIPVRDIMRAPVFIPESMPADDVLPRLRLFRQRLGLVRNEDGEVTGLVTTEDVLEEIVGKLNGR